MNKSKFYLTPDEIEEVGDTAWLAHPGATLGRDIEERNAIAKASANHAIKTLVKQIKANLSGSVHYPRSGEHGEGTSHVRLNDDFYQELLKLVEEL